MTRRKNNISQSRLMELVRYNPDTGAFIRNHVPGRGWRPAGERADRVHVDGYSYVTVDRKPCLAHRLAWIYTYGEVPECIDHINGIKSDNRLSNLRLATHHQNQCNHKRQARNSSGVKGVCWVKGKGKWAAQCQVDKKPHWIGLFNTIEEAAAAVRQFREMHHGEFANHG